MRLSTSSAVADYVAQLAPGSFVEAADVDRPRGAVDTALSRLCAGDSLVRARKGLYWKGIVTRFGMTRPRPEDVAIKVGGPGSGPSSLAAAHWLGLTTQVPATFTVAVPIRAPRSWGNVRFTERSVGRLLRQLGPTEVALIEVLRSGPASVESPWTAVAAVTRELATAGKVRPSVIDEQIRDEHHVATRQRWNELVAVTPTLSKAMA